jgi:hypothetical protein
MAWSASAIFRAFVTDMAGNVAAFDLSGTGVDTFKVALYDNDITPSKDASSANSAYNVDQWTASGNEVSDGTEWDAAGEPLASPAITNPSGGVVMWDATDTVSGGSSATLANVYGCLVYDDTLASPVADQGVSYHYFGGTQSVTDGTFTVVWHENGMWRISV